MILRQHPVEDSGKLAVSVDISISRKHRNCIAQSDSRKTKRQSEEMGWVTNSCRIRLAQGLAWTPPKREDKSEDNAVRRRRLRQCSV